MFKIKQESFPEREETILELWKQAKVFEKSVDERKDRELFSFYDGPPFATGLPHYGHLLAGTIKDVVPRYKTMKGYYVPRRFGWDCHGLPIENEIEKAKELSGAISIEEFGIANFNEECRSIVLRYTEEWKKTVNRMGRWVDFSNIYRTMDPSFMESVWWVFKELWNKGLVYEGFKVMPFSMQLGTPLSNFEANLNYREVDDPSLTVAFKSLDEEDTYFLAWTTTPWTLISNLALAVGSKLNYMKVKRKEDGKKFILSEARLTAHFKDPEAYEVLEEMSGEKLKGRKYAPLFGYFENTENAFQILADDFVSTEDGTGIVHCAPAFGEVDFFVCKENGIELVCPVDHNGRFTKEVPEYEGVLVKDTDKKIIRHLKEEGKIFHQRTIRHRYPFCWRSDTPLIYKAVRTWFVSVEKIKNKLIDANKEIHWVPGHLKEGRFGKWLENARDWAISRNRYWGTPIPIWRSGDGDIDVIGSLDELEEKTGKKTNDLHRHFIDDLTFEKDGKTYKRIPEVFDCWFESGSMPYSQNHYPFENKEETEKGFPADFIAEGLDQTRGWFYTLNVLSTALFEKPAFKNVIVNGILLTEDGAKMSKRLKNYPEPDAVIHKYGADAIRLYMLHSPAVKGDDLRLSERGVELVLRQILIPFWNSYSFLATYANIYGWKPNKSGRPKADIDRWILSLLQKLIEEVEDGMDQYDLSKAVEPFVGFIDQLTNWYIRRCRTRFWSDEDTPDRREAFDTLYRVLKYLSKIAAPFVPFLSDAIYQQLRLKEEPESVHLCEFPRYADELRDLALEDEMRYVQKSVSIGHALRKEHKIKVRQPLSRVHLITGNADIYSSIERQKNLIAEELNVKKVDLEKDQDKFIQVTAKPNFRVLGKKVGKLMPKVQKLIAAFDRKQMDALEKGKNVSIEIEGESFTLTHEDVTVERKVKEGLATGGDQELAIALDTALTDELLMEGLAREIVNKVNTMRRNEGFDVTDRIKIIIQSTDRVKACFSEYKDYIEHEVLAVDVQFVSTEGTKWDLNGEDSVIAISKASAAKVEKS